MELAEGFLLPPLITLRKELVCKLRKALYGLKQSGQTWYQTLAQFLIYVGFTLSEADINMYLQHLGHSFIILAIYVDDCLLIGNDEHLLQRIKEQLSSEFEMTDLGPITRTSILDLELSYNQQAGTLKINQSIYIQSLLTKFKMESCNLVSTPVEPGIKLTKEDCPTTDDEIAHMKACPYKTLVGSLSHIALNTRPNISFSVNTLAQYLSNPGLRHWNAGKRTLRYLKCTLTLGLLHKCSKQPLILRSFSDVDWAGNLDDRRSTSGYCFMLGNCVVTWASRTQRSVALSSTGNEYMSLSKASREAIWLCRLLSIIGCRQLLTTNIQSDNQSAIKLSENLRFHDHSKHIDI